MKSLHLKEADTGINLIGNKIIIIKKKNNERVRRVLSKLVCRCQTKSNIQNDHNSIKNRLTYRFFNLLVSIPDITRISLRLVLSLYYSIANNRGLTT